MKIHITDLIYFMNSQAVRTPQDPTTTPKFTRTTSCVNRKIIDYETKAGEVLYM